MLIKSIQNGRRIHTISLVSTDVQYVDPESQAHSPQIGPVACVMILSLTSGILLGIRGKICR